MFHAEQPHMTQPPDYEAIKTAPQPTLLRSMGPWQVAFYGVGGMLGAGIYGLVGEAAGMLGNAVWIAFVAAMCGALLTGLSYACIGSRYPRAAGAAFVTQRAYRSGALTYIVGLTVGASGLTSMATGSRVIGRVLSESGLPVPVEYIAICYLALLSLVVFWGIRQSMWLNILCTCVEVAGLALIIVVGCRYWGSVNYLQGPPDPSGATSPISVAIVLSGAVLTFFSFIGFEDILNVSEEVKNPSRNIPIGLITAMLVSTGIYLCIAVTAVSVVPHDVLVARGLRGVMAEAAPWFPQWLFSAITIFSVANTALLNYVMASRLIYGMSRQRLLPPVLGRVHPQTHTPHVAIFLLLGIIVMMMLIGHITELASATVLLLLLAFIIVNLALVVLKRRAGEPRGKFEAPVLVPLLGAMVCAALLVARVVARDKQGNWDYKAPLIAGVVVGLSVLAFAIFRPSISEDAVGLE